jgi:hypothetical protein
MATKPPSTGKLRALSGHEEHSVRARLAQIEVELKFPRLTEGQCAALERERMALLNRLVLGDAHPSKEMAI